MRKVFLDLGAHEGESIRLFRSQYPQAEEYKIFSFEPNPAMVNNFAQFPDVEFHNVGVWVEDGESKMTIHDWTVGYSLFNTHPRHYGREPSLPIKVIDFSKWMKENIKEDDYVVMKMDIEGSEYKVLRKMIDEGSILLVNKLYMEFHDHWMVLQPGEHDALKAELVAMGLRPLDWCAGPGRTHIPEKEALYAI